ncbi:hypothetical protein M011DRAFT_482061 [Sporormia fimetaria CBS 119925]|uniref:Uncharacterized protein n=1 Tax=Sporormia fimetaria CBS 119925 TaxID=1340428 RepID=A0A6A6UV39_9PLEO|nr:hypothetical protein M011DRAFT_482061 [Sporormia fimetaria CBS 119925]
MAYETRPSGRDDRCGLHLANLRQTVSGNRFDAEARRYRTAINDFDDKVRRCKEELGPAADMSSNAARAFSTTDPEVDFNAGTGSNAHATPSLPALAAPQPFTHGTTTPVATAAAMGLHQAELVDGYHVDPYAGQAPNSRIPPPQATGEAQSSQVKDQGGGL